MGYRSDGWLYLSNKALEVIKESKKDGEFIDSFLEKCEEHTTKVNVWVFEYREWHIGHSDVPRLYELLDKLVGRKLQDEYDFIVVGENNTVVVDYYTERAFSIDISVAAAHV